ncbi:MAG TPA: VOC family protein [Thermoplasmata archaeon]|nr:VOC family protein [Thermoplasmata archaeon]
MIELAEPLNLCLLVGDLEKAREFYGEQLGLPLWREEPAEALHFGAGTFLLTVQVASAGELPARGSRLVFAVTTNLDALCGELGRKGIVFEEPLADRPHGRSAMFRDPDGREIWVCRPSETETQFHRWRQSHRSRERRIPVQRRAQVRRHERAPRSRRARHPSE